MISAVVITACGGSAATSKTNPSPSAVQFVNPSLSGIKYADLTVAGLARNYLLYVPPSLDLTQLAPLVVALTGCPNTAEALAATTNFDAEARDGGFIVVYPDPVGGCWNAGGGCCSLSATPNSVDDIAFITALLDRLSTEFRIDQTRIFAAGFSGGGFMAYRLACEMSDRFAAIASVSGAMVVGNCLPSRPVSILEMHGTADTHVSYAGAGGLPSTAFLVEGWVARDGCPGDPTHTVSGITKTSIWVGCREATVVKFDTVMGGHHTWFGSNFVTMSDPVAEEPNATVVVWDFFSHLAPRAR